VRRLFFIFTLLGGLCHAHAQSAQALSQSAQALSQSAQAEAAPFLRVLNTDQDEAKRIEAMRLLEKMGGIDALQIARSICDTSPAIRAAMVRLGSRMAATDPELELRLIALANDRSPLVQAQMLKSLPLFPSARASAAFQKLLSTALTAKDPSLRALAESLTKKP